MVLSMTGYGRGERTLDGRDITVEIRSVNSRYFEYSSRLPRGYQCFDDRIKKAVGARVSRGKVEVGLLVKNAGAQDVTVVPNTALAGEYLRALRELAGTLSLRDDVGVSGLLRFEGVLSEIPAQQDEEQLWQDILTVLSEALDRFIAMRAAEGDKMKEDILSRLDFLEDVVGKVEADSAGRVEKYTARLYERLKTVLEDRGIDDARILTEAALFADKTAVDEETVRLHSHFRQYRDTLAAGGPVGRKLDFLTQELNRETNTIGSKCQELEITRLVVDMKAEIEKIREQIQNVE